MKHIQSAIFLVLIAFLFIGNSIGADVFKHVCSEEGTLSVGDIIENLLIDKGQTVNIECIDNGYGNSNYEIIT